MAEICLTEAGNNNRNLTINLHDRATSRIDDIYLSLSSIISLDQIKISHPLCVRLPLIGRGSFPHTYDALRKIMNSTTPHKLEYDKNFPAPLAVPVDGHSVKRAMLCDDDGERQFLLLDLCQSPKGRFFTLTQRSPDLGSPEKYGKVGPLVFFEQDNLETFKSMEILQDGMIKDKSAVVAMAEQAFKLSEANYERVANLQSDINAYIATLTEPEPVHANKVKSQKTKPKRKR